MGDADFDKSAYAAGRLAPAARDDAADLAVALWRNEALCCLKLDEWREAEDCVDFDCELAEHLRGQPILAARPMFKKAVDEADAWFGYEFLYLLFS